MKLIKKNVKTQGRTCVVVGVSDSSFRLLFLPFVVNMLGLPFPPAAQSSADRRHSMFHCAPVKISVTAPLWF